MIIQEVSYLIKRNFEWKILPGKYYFPEVSYRIKKNLNGKSPQGNTTCFIHSVILMWMILRETMLVSLPIPKLRSIDGIRPSSAVNWPKRSWRPSDLNRLSDGMTTEPGLTSIKTTNFITEKQTSSSQRKTMSLFGQSTCGMICNNWNIVWVAMRPWANKHTSMIAMGVRISSSRKS